MSDRGFLTDSQEGDDVCSICIEVFENPISLKCEHNFCFECAKMCLKEVEPSTKKTKTRSNYYIICPLCEVKTVTDKNLSKLKKNKALKIASDKIRAELPELNSVETLSIKSTSNIDLPRNMKLLNEYDASIGKDGKTFVPLIHTGYIGYGTDETKDDNTSMTLTYWQGMLIAPQDSPIGALIYMFLLKVPDNYPKEPPIFKFTNPKLKMDCVDEVTGIVDPKKIFSVDMTKCNAEGMVEELSGSKFKWNKSHNIADLLIAIRENMHFVTVCKESSSMGSASFAEIPDW